MSATYTITRHAVRKEVFEGEATWEVVDGDGDVVETAGTKAEALQIALELDRAAQEEKDEEEAGDLRGEITDLLDGMDLKTLRKLASRLKA